jgi:hypothetical protein
MPDIAPYLDIKIGGLRRSVSDLEGLFSHSARIGIPEDFPLQGLSWAQIDLEVLSEKLRQNANEVRLLLQAL